jgi:hypothetical protein
MVVVGGGGDVTVFPPPQAARKRKGKSRMHVGQYASLTIRRERWECKVTICNLVGRMSVYQRGFPVLWSSNEDRSSKF